MYSALKKIDRCKTKQFNYLKEISILQIFKNCLVCLRLNESLARIKAMLDSGFIQAD